MAKCRKPLLGVTMGDPCGIGPEMVLRALADRQARAAARFMVFGSGAILERIASEFKLACPQWRVASADENLSGQDGPFLRDIANAPAALALQGHPTADGGEASVQWICGAVQQALDDRLDAIVTAPISKEAMHLAGHDWPGHTEMIAAKCGVEKPVMMMVGGGLRTALVTTHASIKALPELITLKNVLDTIRITDGDLRRYFGLNPPRIAVCGLNPHAGEAGRFGDEEARAIRPAIVEARRLGIHCDGPLSADVAYTARYCERYDAVVAMYHDQATIPVKMLAFESGVNVTLGLPIIRTSPDHGTAYDIVRRGIADPGSMLAAIRLAAEMARKRLAPPDRQP